MIPSERRVKGFLNRVVGKNGAGRGRYGSGGRKITLWEQGSVRGQVVDVFGVNKATDYAVAGKRARGRAAVTEH